MACLQVFAQWAYVARAAPPAGGILRSELIDDALDEEEGRFRWPATWRTSYLEGEIDPLTLPVGGESGRQQHNI